MIDVNKLIEVVNQYKRIKLTGVFESGVMLNNEKIVVKTNRIIRIEKIFDRYKFYMDGYTQYVKEDRLTQIFNNLIGVKVNKVTVIK